MKKIITLFIASLLICTACKKEKINSIPEKAADWHSWPIYWKTDSIQ